MKSEERHRLEQNELAAWIARTGEEVGKYAKAILLGVAVVLLAYLGWNWWKHYSAQGAAQAWQRFHAAVNQQNLPELDDLAEQFPSDQIGQWSALQAADIRLLQGSQAMFTHRATAVQDLDRAVDEYTQVIERSREPQLRERALFGRARAYESLAGSRQGEGQLDKAIADYKLISESYAKGPFAEAAARRAEQLQSKQARVFYDQFAAFVPNPPAPGKPGDLGLPFGSGGLPDLPEPEFSRLLNLGAPDKDAKKDTDAKKADEKTSSPNPDAKPEAKPEAAGPAAKPDAAKSDTAKPDTAKPDTAKPDAAKPEFTTPPAQAEKPSEPAKAEAKKP